MFDVDQDEQGGRRGDRSTLYILDPGREIQFPAIARPCIGVQGVRRGKQNRREVVEFEMARHAEFSDRVEQETEKIVDYGRHRAAVCYPGRPYVTLVEEVVSNDAVSATPYRQVMPVRVRRPAPKTVGVVGWQLRRARFFQRPE